MGMGNRVGSRYPFCAALDTIGKYFGGETVYDFGYILKEERKKRGLTQKQLGDRLNVTEATVSKYESNTATPPFETMRAIAAIFNVSLDFLYGNEPAGALPLYGLSKEQTEILRDLAALFQLQNGSLGKKAEMEQYQMLGRITACFFEEKK